YDAHGCAKLPRYLERTVRHHVSPPAGGGVRCGVFKNGVSDGKEFLVLRADWNTDPRRDAGLRSSVLLSRVPHAVFQRRRQHRRARAVPVDFLCRWAPCRGARQYHGKMNLASRPTVELDRAGKEWAAVARADGQPRAIGQAAVAARYRCDTRDEPQSVVPDLAPDLRRRHVAR